jgi:hypothetical protein
MELPPKLLSWKMRRLRRHTRLHQPTPEEEDLLDESEDGKKDNGRKQKLDKQTRFIENMTLVDNILVNNKQPI